MMKSWLDLKCEKEEHVAVIHIDAPPRNQEELSFLGSRLCGQFDDLSLDNHIRVIVLMGSRDDSFSMETALKEDVYRTNICPSVGPSGITEAFSDFYRPVIAGLRGEVSGQGLELALACDLRIAAESSHFSLPHIKHGLIPWEGGTQRLSGIVGKSKALEMVLMGEHIGAEEAYRIGLVNKVVPTSELKKVVVDMAHEMGKRSPLSLSYIKEAIVKGMDLTLSQGLRLEADLYYLIHTTRDRVEGIKAFREKRKAQFQGE